VGIAADYRGPSGKILPGVKANAVEIIKRLRPLFAQRKEVLLAYLFGSHAHGEARESSDVDVAVLLEPDIIGKELHGVYRDLLLDIRETLGTERFYLILLNRAPLSLKFEIVSHGKLIYAQDEDVLNNFELEVTRKYQDTAYLRGVQDYYRRERVRQWCSKGKASRPA
jgi:hypothetical protein